MQKQPPNRPNPSSRLVSGNVRTEDAGLDTSLRPRLLNEFVGQERVKDNLLIAIRAALMREEPLDHVLLYGPPGLGKTTLGYIIAQEMNVNIRVTSGPAIERAGDMAAVLTSLGKGDVLFIDEIHRLSRVVEEVLYPAMEDFFLSWMMGKGLAARAMNLRVNPVYPHRRDHPLRHDKPAPAGPVRVHLPAGLLRREGDETYSQALRHDSGRGCGQTGDQGDSQPFPRHSQGGQPAAEAHP